METVIVTAYGRKKVELPNDALMVQISNINALRVHRPAGRKSKEIQKGA